MRSSSHSDEPPFDQRFGLQRVAACDGGMAEFADRVDGRCEHARIIFVADDAHALAHAITDGEEQQSNSVMLLVPPISLNFSHIGIVARVEVVVRHVIAVTELVSVYFAVATEFT